MSPYHSAFDPKKVKTAKQKVKTDSIEDINDAINMFNQVKVDFKQSIDNYRKHSENWFYGWVMEMEQQVIVNGSERSADVDDTRIKADLITCPADGKITLVHCFEAEAFVPIGGTPFKIQPVKKIQTPQYSPHHMHPTGYINDGKAVEGNIGHNGFAELTLDPSYRGKLLRITFYPDVGEKDIQAMLNSYDPTINKLSSWLEKQWEEELHKEWEFYFANPVNVWEQVGDFFKNVLDALIDAWDEVAGLFKLLANPGELKEMLAKYIEDPERIAEQLATGKEKAAEMFMLLKDEARCFLCLNAVLSWLKLLSPLQIMSLISVSLATILVEVVISIVIPGGIALKVLNYTREAAGVVAMTGVNDE